MNIGRQALGLLRPIGPKRLQRGAILCVALAMAALIARAERLPIKTFTTVDGLANNVINKIVRDSRGFLWFCTSDGLSRFDGYAFTNYGTDQGLPQREVFDFLETRGGEYWVATAAGLVRFNPKAPPAPRVIYAKDASPSLPMFSLIVPEEADPARRVITRLLEDRSGTVWCGTYKGLYRLERTGGNLALRPTDIGIPEEWPEGHTIFDLLEDRSGSLWVATPGGLYRRWPDGTSARYTKRDGLPDEYFHCLLEDHEGGLWAGTRYGGFFQFEGDQTLRPPVVRRAYSTREGMPHSWVFRLFETSDHKFWIASARGLLEFFPNRDVQGRWFHSYSERNGLSYSNVTAINEDLGGNLWLGTNTAGVMKLARNGFVTYDKGDGLYGVNSIFGDRAGGVCFRGDVVGDKRTSVFEGAKLNAQGRTPDYHHTRLGRFDGQRFTWFLPNSVSDLCWLSEGKTLQARNGEWWVGAAQGLYRYPAADDFTQIKKARPFAVYTKGNGIGGFVNRIFEDSQGNIWVSNFSPKPLLLWERASESFRDISAAPGFPEDSRARSFREDRTGNVWIGLDGEIVRYHDGSLTLFNASDGVPPGVITSIYLDHAGRLWLASSQSGLIRIDDPESERPRLAVYTTAQGLSSNSSEGGAAHLIVEDLQGHIYIGTGRGLDRLDPETGHFKHFTAADGLAPGSFRACFRDRYGGLWFGMTGGLSHLIRAVDEKPEAPPPILLSGLQVAGSRQFVSALGESDMLLPDLTAGQNQLQIDFIGLSFAPGELLHYQYMLEGVDADWSAPTEQRSVTYKLAPGRYKFLVRAVNSDGVVSPNPAVITFRILPPLWARSWFLTLVAIGLTLILYRFYRYRLARLLELERVRTRIATDLHDDIGSSLSRMAILSEVAKRRMEGTHNEAVSILTEIAESARAVVGSMSDIVWAIDPRRDDLSNVVFRIRQFASDVLGARGIAWSLQAPAEFDRVKLNPQQRRQIFLIFKEAISNSARHAGCNSVWLSLSIVRNQIIGEVRDDGRGLAADSLDQHCGDGRGGHGLENIRMRVAQLGGHLFIDSSPDRGTSIRVEVPLRSPMA